MHLLFYSSFLSKVCFNSITDLVKNFRLGLLVLRSERQVMRGGGHGAERKSRLRFNDWFGLCTKLTFQILYFLFESVYDICVLADVVFNAENVSLRACFDVLCSVCIL